MIEQPLPPGGPGARMTGVSGARSRVWRYVGVGLPLLGLLVPVLLVAVRRPAVSQPIEFNHLKHTKDLQLDCQFCHEYVTSGAHSGLPAADKCGICHQVPQGESAEAARVTELLTRGDPLQFNKLFRLADHVFYTHSRHVGIAKLECERCHGGIATTERPPKRPLVTITMDYCISCHRETGQSVDCVTCHR